MLQAAKRIADALVGKAAPKISKSHHEFPDEIRDGLGRITHKDEQLAPDAEDPPIGQATSTGPASGLTGAGSGTVDVQLLTEDDWAVRRDLALRAIADAPSRWQTTLAEAAARSEQEWRDKITGRTSSFAAFRDGKPVGDLNAAPSDRPGVQEIGGVWVVPEARGTGVGDQLMQTQLQWLIEHGYRQAVLWAHEDNTPMLHLAERHGFTRTGRRSAVRTSHDVPAIEMGRDLT
ncbi:GNAT family N-acetyltransferase [Nocardia brasiliensis]|uniref:GNAT family N-acetyltransferase n=1 Tax=Nocardia brasiliensis TaxID=37326 RepID=UPI0024559CE5|nr:GNAT family N-acetyltransferase [Nocardia brasiliensis]